MNPPGSNSSTRSNSNSILQHQTFHNHGTAPTITALSVPIHNPFYRDLLTLQSDQALVYNQLKLTQQTLQHSYQDLVMAQERSKRAETDSGRLRAQMDLILKKHVEHFPEREVLVQDLAELQAKLDLELASRKHLEKQHALLQQELLQINLRGGGGGGGHGHSGNSNNSSNTYNNINNKSSTSGGKSLFFSSSSSSNSSHSSITSSPTASIRSSTFASFLGRQKQAPSNLNDGSSSIRSNNSDRGSIKSLQQSFASRAGPSSSSSIPATQQQQQQQQQEVLLDSTFVEGSEFVTVSMDQDRDYESLALPSWEDLEADKVVYERLRDENVALKMELQDLRHRNLLEKDSIKGYMSLFEGLQKKQANALAVAQVEMDFLRSTIKEMSIRLDSRQTLIQTFAATINSQAVDLERSSQQIIRERTSRANVEQEMATLLEASLLMLERWFTNIEQTRKRLIGVLDPIRQTVYHLEVPAIVVEWEQCERELQAVMNDLARTVIQQQEEQERELQQQPAGTGFDPRSQVKAMDRHQRRGSSLSSSSTTSSTALTTTTTMTSSASHQEAMLVLDNSSSQDVFVWRKSMADMFLEECVQSVETLAREKRELQSKIVELTQMVMEKEEQKKVGDLNRVEVDFEVVEEEKTEQAKVAKVAKVVENEEVQSVELTKDAKDAISDGRTETRIAIEQSPEQTLQETPVAIQGTVNRQEDPMDRNQCLETILNKLNKLIDIQEGAKDKDASTAKDSTVEDDVLALGFADERPPPIMLTVMRAKVDEIPSARKDELESLIQLIRNELSLAASTPSTSSALETDSSIPTLADIPAQESVLKEGPDLRGEPPTEQNQPGQQEEDNDDETEDEEDDEEDERKDSISTSTTTTTATATAFLPRLFSIRSRRSSSPPISPVTAPKETLLTRRNSHTISTTTTITPSNSITSRPEILTTFQRASTLPSPRSPSSSSLSSSSSFSSTSTSSSTSGYFTNTLGGLSTPSPSSSPGLAGQAPAPLTPQDVNALCRDLAFRSFPRQHHWAIHSSKTLTLLPSRKQINILAQSKPPLPPPSSGTIIITTPTSDTP